MTVHADRDAPRAPGATVVGALDAQHLARLVQQQAQTIEELQRQLDWFKRQLFGKKSERFVAEPDAQQMHLGEVMPVPVGAVVPEQEVPAHKRRKARGDFTEDTPGAPFFDETNVPVHTIEVPNPETKRLDPAQYEVVGQKVSHRLAQRSGAYVVLKYLRTVIKRRDTNTLHCPPAPEDVIQGSRADR